MGLTAPSGRAEHRLMAARLQLEIRRRAQYSAPRRHVGMGAEAL